LIDRLIYWIIHLLIYYVITGLFEFLIVKSLDYI